MSNIPTAEELVRGDDSFRHNLTCKEIRDLINLQSKRYVEAALKAAAENAKVDYGTYFFKDKEKATWVADTYVDKKSILEAYPPENIK